MKSHKELAVFYNVENLFPPDEKFVKGESKKFSGLKKWNEWRYKHKLQRLSHVFGLMKHEKGELPFIIGLAEIADNTVLEDLIQQPVFDGRYAYVHYDSLDERVRDWRLHLMCCSLPCIFFFMVFTLNLRFNIQ